MRFSIIIPVYNVEKYIDKCLYTVMHQTFEDYEVIVVNDETPDNSMTIVQKYADQFPEKIQVIHQKNTRQGGARNNGASKARGEYILFVDSDDYVALNMLEVVDERLKENPCDILFFQHTPVSEQGEELPYLRHNAIAPGVYCPKTDKKVVLLPTGPVNKAFRRDFYVGTQLQFPEKLLYEDGVTRLLYAMADSLVVCDDVLYYYVQSSSSSMRREISEQMLDILPVTDIVIQEFQKRKLYDSFREPLDCALIYGILNILDYVNNAKADHPMQIALADYIVAHFPDYRHNPYVSKTLCRALDDLAKHHFRKYHFHILVLGRMKEKILCIPFAQTLNALRKHRNCFKIDF